MRSSRTLRALMALLAATLVVGAFGPSTAVAKKKKPKKCPAFQPVEPDSNSEQTAEALEAEIQKITDKNTEAAPLVIEYEHGPALWNIDPQMPIVEDTQFFNFQIETKKKTPVGVYMLMEWPGQVSDIDMYWYDKTGAEIYNSGAFNAVPVETPVYDLSDGGAGGTGFESATGFPMLRCDGITLESRAFATNGEPMKLSVWLGDVQEQPE